MDPSFAYKIILPWFFNIELHFQTQSHEEHQVEITELYICYKANDKLMSAYQYG